MCKGEANKQGYDHHDPFQKWARAYTEKVAQDLLSVRKNGFYIVLKMYGAKDTFVNAMMREDHKVSLGFKAKVEPRR
jgi:hypothetical protein